MPSLYRPHYLLQYLLQQPVMGGFSVACWCAPGSLGEPSNKNYYHAFEQQTIAIIQANACSCGSLTMGLHHYTLWQLSLSEIYIVISTDWIPILVIPGEFHPVRKFG